MSNLINYALYQAGWFCCVLGAAYDRPWWGAGVAGFLLVVHLLLVEDRRSEWKIVIAAGIVGAVFDSLQSCAGLLVFRSGSVAGCLAPPWIVLMWMQFATLFRFGLSFLSGRYGLAALLAALGGPLAFFAGSRLGAVEFPPPAVRSLVVLGLVWAIALPFLLWFSSRCHDSGSLAGYRGLGR